MKHDYILSTTDCNEFNRWLKVMKTTTIIFHHYVIETTDHVPVFKMIFIARESELPFLIRLALADFLL